MPDQMGGGRGTLSAQENELVVIKHHATYLGLMAITLSLSLFVPPIFNFYSTILSI